MHSVFRSGLRNREVMTWEAWVLNVFSDHNRQSWVELDDYLTVHREGTNTLEQLLSFMVLQSLWVSAQMCPLRPPKGPGGLSRVSPAN